MRLSAGAPTKRLFMKDSSPAAEVDGVGAEPPGDEGEPTGGGAMRLESHKGGRKRFVEVSSTASDKLTAAFDRRDAAE